MDAEQQVEEIAEAYLDRLQRGEQPDRAALLAAHPDIGEALGKQLDFMDMMHRTKQAVSSVTEPEPTPAPPDRIGRYQIQKALGRGAAGTVYRAYDPKFDRDVALKVLRSDRHLSRETMQRFQREARIVAQLRHPCIVPFHELGESDGFHYLDMELIDGETLEQRLAGTPPDFRAAADLVRKLAEALDYAHRNGIIHRDVKPSNILLVATSPTIVDPQLTDFGLAHRAAGEATLTEEGQIIGTLAYMSPEQAQGGAHQVDGRTDVYSLGAVLYRLLTGRVPFPDADSFTAQLYQIAHVEPPKPRGLNATVPRDLETICLKAMAKDPADRFATAAAFAEELRRWLNDEPLHVRRPAIWERSRRWARRNRLAVRITTAAAVLLLLVGGTLGALAWKAQINQILEARTKAEVQYHALLDRARIRLRLPTQGRRFETQKILEAIGEPRRLIVPGRIRDRLDLEARSLFVASLGVPDLRDDVAKMPSDLGSVWVVWRVTLHPDGKAMAIGTHRGPVRWERGTPLKLPEGLDPTKPRPRLAYSPDGKYLAFTPTTGGLELWDGALTRTMREWKLPGTTQVLAAGFERDGKTLWACCADGRVQALSLPELKEGPHWKIEGTFGPVSEAAFSESATWLAVGNETGRVRLHEANGKYLRELPKSTTAIDALAWSPGGRLVAVGTRDGSLQLWETEGGIPSYRLPVSNSGVSSAQFSPDGRWVMAGFDRTDPVKVWDLTTREQILTGGYAPWGVSPDGRHIAGSSYGGVAFTVLDMPQALRRLTGHHCSVVRLAWSRDNQHLVSLDSGFEVRVWDLAQGGATTDVFLGPRGDLFAHNAAVAVSDDAATVAFASGGDQVATAFQRDVKKRIPLGKEWQLPGGYEQLAYANGKFLLIREEDVLTVKDDKPGLRRPTHAVAYSWEVGKAPVPLREVRPNEPGDVRRFFHHGLTPDARYYWWSGPRQPRQDCRVEVLDVSTGRLTIRVPAPLAPSEWDEPDAALSGEGPYLWIGTKARSRIYDLASTNPPIDTLGRLVIYSPNARWLARYYAADEHRATPVLALQPRGEERTWLEFHNDWNDFQSFSFSPNGRYLAWGDQSGTVTVADLSALEQQVREFEKTVLPE